MGNLPPLRECNFCTETRRLNPKLQGCMGHYPIDAPTQRYGYAVMFVDGEEMGDYVGYFQTDLKDARSVAGEILYNHDEEAGAVGIYELVLVETVHPPKDEDDKT